jgi:hypothetical protein
MRLFIIQPKKVIEKELNKVFWWFLNNTTNMCEIMKLCERDILSLVRNHPSSKCVNKPAFQTNPNSKVTHGTHKFDFLLGK